MAGSDASSEDKQLPATGKRLEEAARKGNVPHSREVGHVMVLGCSIAALSVAGSDLGAQITGVLRSALRFDASVRGAAFELLSHPLGAVQPVVAPLAVVLGSAVAGAAMASVVPGGINLATEALKFDASRLSPMAGLKRVFSVRGMVDLSKLIVLAFVLGAVAFWFGATSFPEFGSLSLRELQGSLGDAASLVLGGFALLVMVLAGVAMFDVPFQWFRHRQDLMMSHDEVKRENRETEGDPMLKGRMRARQRDISRNRMLAAVASADIVLTNPTHYAVAIRYDEAQAGAPRVVAKGVDLIAARIQAIAREAGVPVLESPPLARALYAHVPLDAEIPRELYTAIAQILAYVFQLRRWVPGRGAAPQAPVAIEVPPGLDPGASPRDGADGARA
ncbi:MAG: flagellar biosynthesis protein FlhB [Lautropia sp.]